MWIENKDDQCLPTSDQLLMENELSLLVANPFEKVPVCSQLSFPHPDLESFTFSNCTKCQSSCVLCYELTSGWKR